MKCTLKKALAITVFVPTISFVFADKIHEVKKGETLYSISRSYGISVDAVKEINGLTGNEIKVGQNIKIPETQKKTEDSKKTSSSESPKNQEKKDGSPAKVTVSESTYEVQKGDTWFGISRRFGISVSELLKMNQVDAGSSLKIGQKIKVPSESRADNSKGTEVAKNDAAKNNEKKSEASSKTKTENTKTPDVNVPDLKDNDPHNYSGKKGDSSLVWPVKAGEVTYVNGKIGGVCLTAKKDEGVTSIRAGTVMFCGSYRGFGNVVFIQSKTGHIYAYTGLGTIEVNKGEYINYKSRVGTAGVDSYTGKYQVNLMVFQNGQPVDPAKAPRG